MEETAFVKLQVKEYFKNSNLNCLGKTYFVSEEFQELLQKAIAITIVNA
jgi:hypothetical protein